MEQHFYLLTGVMASGKSTTAQALAERLPRCVHLRGDVFRKMIVTGREEMTSQPTPQALEQLGLRYRLAAQAARGYWEAGFSVVPVSYTHLDVYKRQIPKGGTRLGRLDRKAWCENLCRPWRHGGPPARVLHLKMSHRDIFSLSCAC